MSWHISYDGKEKFENDERGIASSTDAPDDQVSVARESAAAIIASGAVGDTTRDFTVSLSGHSNPEHAPTPGWANDCVGINVTQKS